MTQLETAIVILMKTFDTYAAGDGKKQTISQSKVKTLMEKEMSGLLKVPKNPDEVDQLMKDLDINGDSEVDFSEFVVMVATLACACHYSCNQ